MSTYDDGEPPAPTLSPIPVVSSLEQVYTETSLPFQKLRWSKLKQEFQEKFGEGEKVECVARAPGRVNTIGEHIDYCGFSVLPAAIERDVLIAISLNPHHISSFSKQPSSSNKTIIILKNTDPKFEGVEIEVDLKSDGEGLKMPEKHGWESYFIAGMKGVLNHLHSSQNAPAPSSQPISTTPSHILMLVSGSVPEGSGLSSSSAFVIASSIATLYCLGKVGGEKNENGQGGVDRKEMCEVAIAAGGMDQAASVFSKPLHLLHVDFIPSLNASLVKLPKTSPGFQFVIANSLITSNKAVTAKYCYNLRVAETRVGALLLAKYLNIPIQETNQGNGSKITTFKNVLDYYCSTPPPKAGPKSRKRSLRRSSKYQDNKSSPLSRSSITPDGPTMAAHPSSPLPPDTANCIYELKTILGLCIEALGGPGMEDGLTWEEIALKLGRENDLDELIKECSDSRQVEPTENELGEKRLKIWKRARHVLEEAKRVYEFIEILQNFTKGQESELKDEELLKEMGRLMDESMKSCKEDYECSCGGLDELCELAKKSGALGSRLSGAGWGGATVHLVKEDDVEKFIDSLKEGYYRKRYPKMTEEELNEVVFATKAEAGAGVVKF